ncbi:hypothetical protein B0T26DRAFT_725414 [Lasiosphaeria miniovina]|uniref:PSP1 C-terminal domain-containing protein n=1 Tax=Lasiosphaeria miniovina TaxID=1954250 RepID=A0AA39ZYR0_9PEZI|nr:uncharacterized protein B0T26DRAFT_725414 [Lasiosphaeria miniovina]KAK0706093.1 hypothetical protein B0T26DRAFT_725414 [Lasiosphaeria miniovina]
MPGWDRFRFSIKRKRSARSASSAGSAVSARTLGSQVSDDANGPIYSTLQALLDMLWDFPRSFSKDTRFGNINLSLETFRDQVAQAQSCIYDAAESVVGGSKLTTSKDAYMYLTVVNADSVGVDYVHSQLVILYDDTRLLLKEFSPDAVQQGIGKRQQLSRDEAYDEFAQKVASLRQRFEGWSSRHLSIPSQLSPSALQAASSPNSIPQIYGSAFGLIPNPIARLPPHHIFHIIVFKNERPGLFYTSPTEDSIAIKRGDQVVVSTDDTGGEDFGLAFRCDIAPDTARDVLHRHVINHQQLLARLSSLTWASIPQTPGREDFVLTEADRPRRVLRLASEDEIADAETGKKKREEEVMKYFKGYDTTRTMASDPSGRLATLGFEVLDAEFQSDYKKLRLYCVRNQGCYGLQNFAAGLCEKYNVAVELREFLHLGSDLPVSSQVADSTLGSTGRGARRRKLSGLSWFG